MKIISYNIRHNTFLDILPLWRSRYKRLVDFITKESPDVIGLQEITRKGKRYLRRRLNDYQIVGDSRSSIILTNEYNPILIKRNKTIISYKTYSLSRDINKLGTKSKDDNFPRICTIVHLENDYLIVNTHIDNSDAKNKKRQLEILDNIISKEKKDDERIILLGDFNMTLANDDLNDYSKKYKDPFKNNKNSSFVPNKNIKSLDHIFIDKKLYYSKELIDNKTNDDGYISDHYPLICEIECLHK